MHIETDLQFWHLRYATSKYNNSPEVSGKSKLHLWKTKAKEKQANKKNQ